MNNSYKFIEGINLSEMCDYSFGDQSSIVCNIYNGYMKDANYSNVEFINKLNIISKERDYMTLFIDNIRLYNRDILLNKKEDQNWVNSLMFKNDLLSLCSKFDYMNFIIFTNLEDTAIDEKIEGKIPNNVISIHAVNAIYHNSKVIPFPYGIQRKLTPLDNRHDILSIAMKSNICPTKLLYISHNVNNNIIERFGINELFLNKNWATVSISKIIYSDFVYNIKRHKFVICPIGNAIDCHRNYEVLYLRRVPIMKKNEYLEYLLKDFPVLFVDSYSDITEDLLIKNDFLYQNSLSMDINKLNLNEIYNKIIRDDNN